MSGAADHFVSYTVLAIALICTIMFFLVAIYIALRYHAKVHASFIDNIDNRAVRTLTRIALGIPKPKPFDPPQYATIHI